MSDPCDSARAQPAQAGADPAALLEQQKRQLDAALNAMQQGLCMFGPDNRIELVNRRYSEMMGLPAADLLGMPLLELLRIRKAAGRLTRDPEQLVAEVLANVRARRTTTYVVEGTDGRALRINNQPLPSGGWVSTLEDVTELRRAELQRERQWEFLNQIIDNVPVMVVVKDARGRFLHVNKAAEKFWGISRSKAIGRTMHEVFPHTPTEDIERRDAEALQLGQSTTHEAHPSIAPDSEKIVTSKRYAIRNADGRPLYLITVVEDVTERVRLERERNRNREFLNQIIESVPTTIIVKDVRTWRYVLANQAAVEHFGVPRERIIGKTAHEILPKASADLIEDHDRQVLRSGAAMFFDEYPIQSPGHGPRFITARKLLVRNPAGEPRFIIGVVEDVTDRRQSQERISHLAHHDALTDLPNRVHFREQLEQALKRVRRGEKLAVLFLDLDKFKGVNDTLGHQGGDELLKTVAARLKECVRETDIVARLGGDEFAIVQTSISGAADATQLAERIHAALRQPCELEGNRFSTDASIGIAVAPADGSEADQLVNNADLAMYGAKADGRGTYRFFESAMDAEIKARRAIEFDLRQAIMCGEFELLYQPLVNIREKSIVGCEALLRWRHPTRGLVLPGEFIPVAEDAGIVHQLGEWALRTACSEAVNWRDDIVVNVNVSPVQFKNDSLVQVVVSALAESGLPAHRLELEITESVLLHDNETTFRMLHQLKELGVRIAMDDFGTGYSSLNYLQRFPFDKVKIDRSFIEHIADDAGSLAIVQAIISIAESRKIATTAEGVETSGQLELLRTLGCTEMQGFLFSTPKPLAELAPMLEPKRPLSRSVA